MRKFILICIAAFGCAALSAQDIIHLVGSRPIEAEVIEIGERDIVYKDFKNLNGPKYRLSVSRVSFIDFANGRRQIFKQGGRHVHGRLDTGRDYLLDDLRYGSPFALDYRHGGYYRHNRRMSSSEIADIIGLSLYGGEYRQARNRYFWGVSLTAVGAVGAIVSAADLIGTKSFNDFSDDPFFSDLSYSGPVIGCVLSAACLGAGIPLWSSGGRRLNRIADDYNRNYGRRHFGQGATVSIGPGRSGVGLALSF